jgi:TolB-like protein/DNA-binding winged helix-turn-helix (wHTH) protein/Flp pilus assembly protein TadD
MTSTRGIRYEFADLTVDLGRRGVERGGAPIELGKLSFLLLAALVETAPDVLGHDEVVRRVWGGRATSPETVTQRVKLLRDALGDDAERPRYIGLVRGHGYRLIPPVRTVRASDDAASQTAAARGPSSAPPAASARPARAPWRVVGVAALSLAAVASALYVEHRRAPPTDALPSSVAVLPFKNLSPDPANAFFAAGVQETLLRDLTALKALNVIARSSVERYADGRTPPAEIAQQLRVQTLLSGSVQYTGDRVLINAELVDPTTGAQLWAQSYDRKLDDIFLIESDIASAIAAALKAQLLPAERLDLETPPTKSAAAYALYLEALRDAGRRRLPLEDDRARLPLINRAIELDPQFAEAYLARANVYVWAVAYSELASRADDATQRQDYERLALDDAERAAEIDPSLPGPWVVRGILHLEAWRWEDAEAAFARALDLGPNDPNVLLEACYFRLYAGDMEAGLRYARRRHELDPNSVDSNIALAFAALLGGNTELAVDRYREAVRLAPGLWFWWRFLAQAQINEGDLEGAERSLRTAEQLRGPDDTGLFMSAVAGDYRRLGLDVDAQRAVHAFEAWAQHAMPSAGDWATAYAGVGDYDKAFEWLGLAVAKTKAHEPDTHQALIVIALNTVHDPVLEEPRFRELRAQLLPPAKRAAFLAAPTGTAR